MVHQIASDPEIQIPVSGIGGIQTWQDAVEFMLLGATSVQVCTAVMHYGFRVVEGLISGLSNWMDEKGFRTPNDFIGKTMSHVTDWGNLDLNYKITASIDQEKCIHCGLCYAACEDGAHQSILKSEAVVNGTPQGVYTINQESCVGCNMCQIVCPAQGCISMVEHNTGKPVMSWKQYQEKVSKGEMKPLPPPSH
jgi:dihydropyrimidine dehydrogenase (NAD+) subunit PreA